MKKRQPYLLLLLLLVCGISYGQADSAQVNDTAMQVKPTAGKPLSYDTNYIEKFGDVVAIEPWLSFPTFQFNIEADDTNARSASYRPYMRNVLGIDVNYRNINLSVGVRSPAIAVEENLYGKTNYTALKLRLNSKPFVYELYYNNIQGFADYSTPAYDTARPPGQPYIKRADINVQYAKLKMIYIFSKRKFSYGAAYSFTERQKKTKATALLVGHAYRLKCDADSAFLNPGQREFFGKYDSMKHLDVVSVGVGPGAAATFVQGKWFFSIGLYVIVDAQYHHANNEQGRLISEGWRAAALGDAFLSLGYNGNKFYTGIVIRGDQNMVSLPFVNASTTFFSSVFSVGFRFNPPKIVPTLYDRSPMRYF